MPPTPKTIPVTYPQPLGTQILKADAHRQASMLRQEFVTELLGVLGEVRDPGVRQRLTKLVEHNLKLGLAAAAKAEELWPSLEEVNDLLAQKEDLKPAAAKRHLKLFEQYDRVQQRSLELLTDSFGHTRVILDRLQPPEPDAAKPA